MNGAGLLAILEVMLKTLFATAALCALGAGCAHPRLHVIGDRPAEVYVKAETGSLTEALKEKLDLGPTSHYVGRTRVGGDKSIGLDGNPVSQGPAEYSYFYKLPGQPERVVVEVKSAEKKWEYTVYFDQDKEMTIFYPKIGESVPIAEQPQKQGEPQPGAPRPASMPR